MPYSAHAPDYIVVVSDMEDYANGFHDFAERVNRKLKSGYKLHGAPFNIQRIICQAMIKPGAAAHDHHESGVNEHSFHAPAVQVA